MTLLESRDSPVTEVEKEALIKEARRLRRRRWLFGSALTALAVGAGIGGYLIASGPPPTPHRAAPAHSSSARGSLASARVFLPARSPDLLQPSTLASLPNGDVLILDSSRDQILALRPDGELSVFAGTGRLGFSGDGGPARDADLHFVSGESAGMTVTRAGAVDFLDEGNCRIRQISPHGTIRTTSDSRCQEHPAGPCAPLMLSRRRRPERFTSVPAHRSNVSRRLVISSGSLEASDHLTTSRRIPPAQTSPWNRTRWRSTARVTSSSQASR